MDKDLEKAVEFAINIATRDQRGQRVYKDPRQTDDIYYVGTTQYVPPSYAVVLAEVSWPKLKVKELKGSAQKQTPVGAKTKKIKDFESLSVGDVVLVLGESQKITKVSDRQIVAGRYKFKRSDGSEWGRTGKLQLEEMVI